MKVTDYHRSVVAEYYKQLIDRFGIKSVLKWIPTIKKIVWTSAGLAKVERKIERT